MSAFWFLLYQHITLMPQQLHDNLQATTNEFIVDASCRGIEIRDHSGITGPIKLDEGGASFSFLMESFTKG
jgi:hypothetical protein